MNVTDQEMMEIVRTARTVAVEGMQDEAKMDRPAYHIPARLKQMGMKVYPVNPNIQSSLGEKAYPSLKEVPERVDILDVFRRPDVIPALADEILALPRKNAPKWFGSNRASRTPKRKQGWKRQGSRSFPTPAWGSWRVKRDNEPRTRRKTEKTKSIYPPMNTD